MNATDSTAMHGISITSRPERGAVIELLRAAGLPTDDVSELQLDHFFFIGTPEAPIGLVGLEMKPPAALLRSLVVVPDARGIGSGSRLVAHAEQYARAGGVRTLFLLTTTAERFFAARGYTRIERDDAPASIRDTREFARLCPASAACMSKPL